MNHLQAAPPPLYGHEPDTWQYDTMTQRISEIAQRVIDENDLTAEQLQRMRRLQDEMPYGLVRPLDDPAAPDAAAWAAYVAPYVGRNWLDIPWFMAEMMFFRRVLEATGYFGPGVGEGRDPYRQQKAAGMAAAAEALPTLLPVVERPLTAETLRQVLVMDLWGNQADLSIWPSDGGAGPVQPERAHLLIDDLPEVVTYLEDARTRGPLRVDFLVDNAGIELTGDLLTADYLLRHGVAATVQLHVKPYPTFVSDAMIPDVAAAIEQLAGAAQPEAAAIGARLRRRLSDGSLALRTHLFWTSPLPFWELPADLRDVLGRSDLLIVKGDMNYRRLHGDRHWPFDTPFDAIVAGAPAPLVCLRVVKAEVASGLSRAQVAEVTEADPGWMSNGRWGMAPFYRPGAA
jgi:uncharacterized protein with ATP-grasp and redox domains